MDPKEITEHPVALKVMRLTKPTLVVPKIVTCDSKDLPGNILNNFLSEDPVSVKKMETIAAGQFLLLPQSFGNIYLGETFSCYVCVHNEAKEPVPNVSIKADLQTSNQRIPLATHQKENSILLGSTDTLNDVISHEVKDLGTHILVCEVTYMSKFNTLTSFRKFFKFEVLKPLDVKTKFYNADSNDVHLEAQVQNITTNAITLEQVTFESSPHFTFKSLNVLPDGSSIFGGITMLLPKETCQFLYCLTPKKSVAEDLKQLTAARNVGKLDIVWRSNMGEKGRLQTSQLQRGAPDFGDVRLVFEGIPSKVELEQSFDVCCKIVNNCERTLDLVLKIHVDDHSPFFWSGIANRKLGPLAPGSSTSIELSAIALTPGLQALNGISLEDSFLKRTFNYDDMASIYVY